MRAGEDHPLHYGPDTEVQDTQVRARWSPAMATETPKISIKAKNATIKLMVKIFHESRISVDGSS